jgi:hypothetical protein
MQLPSTGMIGDTIPDLFFEPSYASEGLANVPRYSTISRKKLISIAGLRHLQDL